MVWEEQNSVDGRGGKEAEKIGGKRCTYALRGRLGQALGVSAAASGSRVIQLVQAETCSWKPLEEPELSTQSLGPSFASKSRSESMQKNEEEEMKSI